MGLVLPPLEASHVQPLPSVKAYADQMGFVEVINQIVPTAMASAPGTMVLGMLLDTLSGRRPLYRWEAFFAHQDTALLLGKAIAPGACDDDTVGRVFDRLSATGPMTVFTAWAVRAAPALHFAQRSVHFDTTSRTVYGEDALPEEPAEQTVPCTMT